MFVFLGQVKSNWTCCQTLAIKQADSCWRWVRLAPSPSLSLVVVVTRFVCALMYAMICFIAPEQYPPIPTSWGIFEKTFSEQVLVRSRLTCIILAGGLSGLFVQFAANYLNSPAPDHLNSRRLVFGASEFGTCPCCWLGGALFAHSLKIDSLALYKLL